MARNQDFAKREELERQVKNFSILSNLGDVMSKLVQLKHVTDRAWERSRRLWGSASEALSRWAIFCNFLEKHDYFNAIWMPFCTFSAPFERTRFLKFESQSNRSLPLLQVKFKTRLKSIILGLNFVTWFKSGKSRYIAFCNIFSIK